MTDRYEKLATDDRESFDFAGNPFSPTFATPNAEATPASAPQSPVAVATTQPKEQLQSAPAIHVVQDEPIGLEFQGWSIIHEVN